jgi:hypothetical protein
MLIRRQLREGHPRAYLRLAQGAVGDPNNRCRWQALIVVSEFIEHEPRAVWSTVDQYATGDADMRMAVTVLLLEELLARDFQAHFPEVAKRVRNGAGHFKAMLPGCWGLTAAQQRRVNSLVRGRDA